MAIKRTDIFQPRNDVSTLYNMECQIQHLYKARCFKDVCCFAESLAQELELERKSRQQQQQQQQAERDVKSPLQGIQSYVFETQCFCIAWEKRKYFCQIFQNISYGIKG